MFNKSPVLFYQYISLECVRGLKPDQVILMMFCPSQVGLIHFIKYPDLSWNLHWITCIDNDVRQ